MASTGCIYFAPDRARRVLCIDTIAGTIELVGPDLGGHESKYTGGVLGHQTDAFVSLQGLLPMF